jgi:hypothetical protein
MCEVLMTHVGAEGKTMSRMLRPSVSVILSWLAFYHLPLLLADNGYPQRTNAYGAGYAGGQAYYYGAGQSNGPTYSYSYVPADSVGQQSKPSNAQPARGYTQSQGYSSSTAYYSNGPAYSCPVQPNYQYYQARPAYRPYSARPAAYPIEAYGPDLDCFELGPIGNTPNDLIPMYGPYDFLTWPW